MSPFCLPLRQIGHFQIDLNLTLALLSLAWLVGAAQLTPGQLAEQYLLPTSTNFAFPTATQNSLGTGDFIVINWSLSKGRLQDGAKNIDFVDNPFPNTSIPGSSSNSTNQTVLRVTYPQGSYSHETGGTQFINLWNTTDGSIWGTMIISYEVAFADGFDWIKGGKLPGLRAGLDSTGCSGGNAATGEDCFSNRVMWRGGGEGEVYAYIPTPNDLCSSDGIICNPDFGTSISRGSFGFETKQWNRITMLVQVNNPPNVANGNIRFFFNDLEAFSRQDLQLRSNSSLGLTGMYFSTFFGGSDESWATPNTTYTYFRNIELWGGSMTSSLSGITVNAAKNRWNINLLACFGFTTAILHAINIY